MEVLLSDETQGILLVTAAEQVKHERNAEEEEYAIGFIYLWVMLAAKGREPESPVSQMCFPQKLLEPNWGNGANMVETRTGYETY
jgi:hypothetical protein